MANPWDAEIQLDERRARDLIESQFPELAPVALRPYGEGWDNVAFLVNQRFVFRFPKRELARPAMENEIVCLSGLPQGLPLAVPVLEFVGRPQAGYAYPFSGYPELTGTTACSAHLSHSQRIACAAPLGAFLRALHAPTLGLVERQELPGDQIRRTDLGYRLAGFEERLDQVEFTHSLSREKLRSAARDLARSAPWQGIKRVIHGDLYARHLLVDDSGRLVGVIDWGDAHLGDPALDLNVMYGFLPKEGRSAFESAYGGIDEATRGRARFRALIYGVTLLHYGDEVDDLAIADAGRLALEHALT